MSSQVISVSAWSPAKPEVVYGLLCSGKTWPVWSPIGSFELEREGQDGSESLGAIRLFRTGPVQSHEEIVALEPNHRFGYALRHGMPLKGYRANVDLTERAGGTAIHWHSAFSPTIPGTGAFFRWFLSGFIQKCADGLAAYAAGLPAANASPT